MHYAGIQPATTTFAILIDNGLLITGNIDIGTYGSLPYFPNSTSRLLGVLPFGGALSAFVTLSRTMVPVGSPPLQGQPAPRVSPLPDSNAHRSYASAPPIVNWGFAMQGAWRCLTPIRTSVFCTEAGHRVVVLSPLQFGATIEGVMTFNLVRSLLRHLRQHALWALILADQPVSRPMNALAFHIDADRRYPVAQHQQTGVTLSERAISLVNLSCKIAQAVSICISTFPELRHVAWHRGIGYQLCQHIVCFCIQMHQYITRFVCLSRKYCPYIPFVMMRIRMVCLCRMWCRVDLRYVAFISYQLMTHHHAIQTTIQGGKNMSEYTPHPTRCTQSNVVVSHRPTVSGAYDILSHRSDFASQQRAVSTQRPTLPRLIVLLAMTSVVARASAVSRFTEQLLDHTQGTGPQLVDIIFASATAVTRATLNNELTVQSTAGVTDAVGQATLDQLLQVQDTSLLQELSDPLAALAEATTGTNGVRTPNPYKGLQTALFHFPNTDEEVAAHPLREVDPYTDLIMGEQKEAYGDKWQDLRELLKQYRHCFAFSPADLKHGMREPTGETLKAIGTFPQLDFDIKLLPGMENKGCYDKERKLNPMEYQAREEYLTDCWEYSLIEEASTSSKFSIPWVVTGKKDLQGEWTDKRCCLDARRINAMSHDHNHRSQTLDQIFQHMEGACFFASLDAKQGFNQVHLTEATKEMSTFQWNGKPFRFTRAWFGAKAMPGHFQALMDHLCKGLKVGVYLDDLIVYASTPEEMLDTLRQLFERCENVGLKLHPKKSVFGTAYTEFLGMMVSPGKLTPAAAKTKAFEALQPPTDVSGLRSAIGLFNYYRLFDPLAGQLVAPMTALLKKEATGSRVPFAQQWGPKQQACFDQMKANLIKPGLAVRHPDYERTFKVHVDFSKHGLGAILAQNDDEGKEYVVCCISRTLNAAERNYSSFAGEMLGVCWALRTFRGYLYGIQFDVYTDHKPLVWLQHNYEITSKHARWFMTIQDLTFRLIHRAGKEHVNADYLSRYALHGDFDPSGARQDFCSETAYVGITMWQEEYCTVGVTCMALNETDWVTDCVSNTNPMSASTVFNNPAKAYMGLASWHDEDEYIGALIQGCTEEACTRHSAVMADSHPDIAMCYQTKALTAFHEDPGSNLFCESQFESLARDSADYLTRSTQYRLQDATRWVVQANRQGMYVSPDASFTWDHHPANTDPGTSKPLLVTKIVGHEWVHRAHQHGVLVLDLFGGMGAMLEGILRNGLTVHRYYYVDACPTAAIIMKHRLNGLYAQFPNQLTKAATSASFSALPQDVRMITMNHLSVVIEDMVDTQSALLIGAGYPCQDLSSAGGAPKGLQGKRSSLLYPAVGIITTLQQATAIARIDDSSRVGYILENVGMQYGHRNQEVLMKDFKTINSILGTPVTFDAATVGSYAHRLRNYWTNIADCTQLQQVYDVIDRDVTRVVAQILDDNHKPKLSLHNDRPPYEPCNIRGYEMRALPTLMATPNSHAFRLDRQGSLWNTDTLSWEEPNADERERAMGYETGTTAAEGVTEEDRRKVLGNAIDQRALTSLLSICIVLPITVRTSKSMMDSRRRFSPAWSQSNSNDTCASTASAPANPLAAGRRRNQQRFPSSQVADVSLRASHLLPVTSIADRAVISASTRGTGVTPHVYLAKDEEAHMQRFADAELRGDWYSRYTPQHDPYDSECEHIHARVPACYLTSSGAPPEYSEGAQVCNAFNMNESTMDQSSNRSCSTAIITTGVAHPPEQDTVVYHFPMHPRAIITADKSRKQSQVDCVRPNWDSKQGTTTDYHWENSRQDHMQGPTRANDFKEPNSLASRTDKQLKEVYAKGFTILKQYDHISGQPLGLYGKGHAWPLDPLKMAKATKGDFIGSQRSKARTNKDLVFVPAASKLGATSLSFKSIRMHGKSGNAAMIGATVTGVCNDDWDDWREEHHDWHVSHECQAATTQSPDDNWVKVELLHDIALHGDAHLQCVARPRVYAPPDATVVPSRRHKTDSRWPKWQPIVGATKQLMTRDPGGASMDPWDDTHLLQCLRGTPVHEIDSDAAERQRIAGRLSAYSLDSMADASDNIERLYRNVLDGTRREVPPPAERLGLVRQVHVQAMHLGVRRTQQLTMRRWYWYSLRQDVRLVVRTCEECARRNLAFHTDDPDLHCLVVMELCYRWSVDLMKLPQSKRGYVRCMICVEHLSRFVIIIPLMVKCAFDVALAFRMHVIGVFGLMGEVLTDQGTEFAAEFHSMLTELGIDHRQTSPYRPQANGLSERIVQVCKKAMHKKTAELGHNDEWEIYAPMIALAYNASVQESTKLTPSTIMMAQLPVVPPNNRHLFTPPLVIGNSDDEHTAAASDLVNRADAIRTAGIYAIANLQTAQQRDTKRYAHTHSGHYSGKLTHIEVGDFVYVFRKQANVLDAKTRQCILRVKSVNDVNRVTLQGRDGRTVVRHRKNLAPCHLINIVTALDDDALDETHESVQCNVCYTQEDEQNLLMCDTDDCLNATHTYCCSPILHSVPDGDWFCSTCSPLHRASGVVPVRLGNIPAPFGDSWAPRPPANKQSDAWTPRLKRGTFTICGKCKHCLRPSLKARCLAPVMLTPVDVVWHPPGYLLPTDEADAAVAIQASPVNSPDAASAPHVPATQIAKPPAVQLPAVTVAADTPGRSTSSDSEVHPTAQGAPVPGHPQRRSRRLSALPENSNPISMATLDLTPELGTFTHRTHRDMTQLDAIHQWIPTHWTSSQWFDRPHSEPLTDHTMAEWIRQAMPGKYTATHVNKIAKLLREVRLAAQNLRTLHAPPPVPYPSSDGNEQSAEVKRRSRLPLGMETVVTLPSEVRTLLNMINFKGVMGICDFWCGTRTIEMVFYQCGFRVHSSDINPLSPAGHADALSACTYSTQKQRPGGLQVLVSSPDFKFLDIAVALAVQSVQLFACIHVPGDYLSNAHPARNQYFMALRTQRRLRIITNLPKGPVGRSNQWLIIFQKDIDPRPYLIGNPPNMSVEHTTVDGELRYRGQAWGDVLGPVGSSNRMANQHSFLGPIDRPPPSFTPRPR